MVVMSKKRLRMLRKYPKFIKLLCTIFTLTAIGQPSRLKVSAQIGQSDDHSDDYSRFDDSSGAPGCLNCFEASGQARGQEQVNQSVVPEQAVLQQSQFNHNIQNEAQHVVNQTTDEDTTSYTAKHNQYYSQGQQQPNSVNQVSESYTNSKNELAYSRSIYPSLLKILYQMTQMDGRNRPPERRTMEDNGPTLAAAVTAATSQPEGGIVPTGMLSSATNAQVVPMSSPLDNQPPQQVSKLSEVATDRNSNAHGAFQAAQPPLPTTTRTPKSSISNQLVTEPTVLFEVYGEPLASSNEKLGSNNNNVNSNNIQNNVSTREEIKWSNPLLGSPFGSPEGVLSERADGKKMTGSSRGQTKLRAYRNQPRSASKSHTSKLKTSFHDDDASLHDQGYATVGQNPEKPLFTLSTGSGNIYRPAAMVDQGADQGQQQQPETEHHSGGVYGRFDSQRNGAQMNNDNRAQQQASAASEATETEETRDESMLPAAPLARPRSRALRQHFRHKQLHNTDQKAMPTSSSGFSPIAATTTMNGGRYTKTMDNYFVANNDLGSSTTAEQQADGDGDETLVRGRTNGLASLLANENYDNSQGRSRLSPSDIHLQQIFPTPSKSSDYIYQQRPAQQTQHQAQQLHTTYHNQPASGAYESSGTSPSQTNGGTNGASQPTYELSAVNSGNLQQQRDLLNQPQTIQITAVPNVGFNNNNNPNLVRLNGALGGGVNGLFGNGFAGLNGMNGFLDPFGRQVLMVNAERRQIDWSFWIWPILLAVALPLVLGALFVPVFLKTVVIIIQLLQSLGLLLPITNALSQQIAQASGNITSQMDQAKVQLLQ